MNYDEIVASSKSYADRFDNEVSDNITTFITMAESKINRLLKTRKQSKRAYILAVENAEYYPLPPDYLGLRDIQFNSDLPENDHSVTQMHYVNPQQMNERRDYPYNGKIYYSIIGDQLHVFPKQDDGGCFEVVYYQRVPNLNELANTNWLSETYPDIYLSGIIAEIEYFAKNYEVANLWVDRMNIAISELDSSDVVERWSGEPLQVRIG